MKIPRSRFMCRYSQPPYPPVSESLRNNTFYQPGLLQQTQKFLSPSLPVADLQLSSFSNVCMPKTLNLIPKILTPQIFNLLISKTRTVNLNTDHRPQATATPAPEDRRTPGK